MRANIFVSAFDSTKYHCTSLEETCGICFPKASVSKLSNSTAGVHLDLRQVRGGPREPGDQPRHPQAAHHPAPHHPSLPVRLSHRSAVQLAVGWIDGSPQSLRGGPQLNPARGLLLVKSALNWDTDAMVIRNWRVG